jgi:2-oxo-4-hydroxy-4-carboxy--5-ureidoimidazoline (OHCU) decarboxylase
VTIEELDALPAKEFVAMASPLFEGAPGFLGRLAAARPFRSEEELFRRALEVARSMPEAEQVELVDAHPRLGAPPGSVSALSYAEQRYDAAAPPVSLAEELDGLNAAYEERFGFRYCVFVAGRSREELMPGFQAALQADREAELDRALAEVMAIARDRYARLRLPEATR